MIGVVGEVIERAVDLPEEAGGEQAELDLLQRPAMELLGHLDLDAALPGGRDDRIGLGQLVRDRRLDQHVQAMLDRHQPGLAVRAIRHADNPNLWRGLADQPIEIGVGRDGEALAQPLGRVGAAAPHRHQLDARHRTQDRAVHAGRASRRADQRDPDGRG